MVRLRALLLLLVCLVLGALASPAWAAQKFQPRVRNALGLFPSLTVQQPDLAAGESLSPVTYHGGPLMIGGITVHTIFWTGRTNPFNPSPGTGVPDFIGTLQQFYTDVAAASTGTSGAGPTDCTNATNRCSVFTVLPQFAQETNVDHATNPMAPPGLISGQNTISYTTTGGTNTGKLTVTGNSIIDADPYPAKAQQCASPQDTPVCVTDQEVQNEVNSVVSAVHGNRGLHDLWYVFLPGGVDECITPGACGTNAFLGYHSLSDVGQGVTIYALTIDPSIESRDAFNPGGDPNGNPDAELTVDVAAHETVEAMTDPEGVGYMGPNGFEVGDKCELGPQVGTILGNAGPDHAVYNQVIGRHKYFLQDMWSNRDTLTNGSPDCVQSTQVTSPPGLPLPQVDLTQFKAGAGNVSGNVGHATRTPVTVVVTLNRAGQVVASSGPVRTDSDGNWTATLPRPAGDDRDEVDVTYSGSGAPTPNTQTVLTGNGGNPFTESGWTGWFALDNGTALTSADQQFKEFSRSPSFMMGPCFQTGVLAATLNGNPLVGGSNREAGPTDWCGTGTDVSDMPLASAPGRSDIVTASSNDNRAFIDPNSPQGPGLPVPNGFGGLVKLIVPVAETDAVGPFPFPLPVAFAPGGIPTCTADLATQFVTCTGLVPNEHYVVNGAPATADHTGTIGVAVPVRRGGTVTLSNGSRPLTVLHVANLRVDLSGDSDTVAGGSCSADQYWGGALTVAPTSSSAGLPSAVGGGASGTGQICPSNGDPTGLPTTTIAQTDDLSGGQTVTEVADVADTSPIEGETVYGTFTALAEATDGISQIKLTITNSKGTEVSSSSNVDTVNGVSVPALRPGTYKATWTVTNPNGDTRVVTTRFIEQPAIQGVPGLTPKVSCELLKRREIRCTITFPHSSIKRGMLRVRVSRAGHLVALGHGRVVHGRATLTMRELRARTRGAWDITVVLGQTVHRATSTHTLPVRMR